MTDRSAVTIFQKMSLSKKLQNFAICIPPLPPFMFDHQNMLSLLLRDGIIIFLGALSYLLSCIHSDLVAANGCHTQSSVEMTFTKTLENII